MYSRMSVFTFSHQPPAAGTLIIRFKCKVKYVHCILGGVQSWASCVLCVLLCMDLIFLLFING